MPELKITHDVYRTILQAAAESPKREICGLLYGSLDSDGGRVGSIYASIANISPSPNQFQMDPQNLIETLFSMKANQDVQLVAIVHSHPFGLSKMNPSQKDLQSHWSTDVWSTIVYRHINDWQMAAFIMNHEHYTQILVSIC